MKTLLAICAPLLLAACAAVGPTGAGGERMLVVGPYAFSPPGEGWRPAAGAVGATYVREDSSQQHTMAIRVLPVIPPDDAREPAGFVDAAKRYNADRLDPERQKVLHESYAPIVVNGLSCVAYEVDGADTALRDGTSVPFVIVGELCRHPWNPDWIDVSFSERGGPGGVRPEVREAGARVLASLRAVQR